MAKTTTWTLDQLKSALKKHPDIKTWAITEENVHRRERYFLLDRGSALATDQDREVRAQNVQARIAVRLPKTGRQGEITKKFFPTVDLDPQIESAVEAARQTDHEEWAFPERITGELPTLRTCDPKMAEDLGRVMDEVSRQIATSVAKKRDTTFNSAELFLSVHDRELHLSNGLVHRYAQSRIYTEVAYSFSKKNAQGQLESDEYLNTRWAVSLGELNVPELYDETSDRAEHSLDVKKPVTGKYPVIVDAEVLATLFNGHVSQLSAMSSYNGLPFVKPGQDLIPDCSGDPITLSIDPSAEFGADTTAVSEQGVSQIPLKLVDRNHVIATAADKQHADYLGIRATTARGNVVVETGSLSHAELTRHAPMVIEILQFSGLFADANSGTFSSEIRLARLYDNVKGTVSYLKGGSLSGSISENFKGARLSSERVKHSHFTSAGYHGQGYVGPKFALLSDVSIVG